MKKLTVLLLIILAMNMEHTRITIFQLDMGHYYHQMQIIILWI